ncbi:MAG: sugar-binding transcriptional regulator [Candidatus Marinimicrobia bacterium]|nr:sugar-binding transcriptional regulator [Candidatus Neomarinimicrobiota bacterium]
MKNTESQTKTVIEAARLYYEHNFSQQQIAQKLGISRPGVSRLLQQARDNGVVKIQIIDPSDKGTLLESQLREKLHLNRVLIVPNDNDDDALIKSRLGSAAAGILDDYVHDGMIFGISWGTTMLSVANHVTKKRLKDLTVVQLNGGVSRADYNTHASDAARKIAEAFGAIPYLLPLPAIVDRSELKDAIITDKNIASTLGIARNATVAMFTIGSFTYDSALVKSNYFDAAEVDELLKKGAVGDICSRIINHEGKICSEEANARTIGIELGDIRAKEISIAVAGGQSKLPAIKAALKAKLCNILVTDELVANELLSDEEL